MVCHPERSEGSRQLFSLANCGDASPAGRDQHDSVRVVCFTYLRDAALATTGSQCREFPIEKSPRRNNRAVATRSPLPEGRQSQPFIGPTLPFAHSASGS